MYNTNPVSNSLHIIMKTQFLVFSVVKKTENYTSKLVNPNTHSFPSSFREALNEKITDGLVNLNSFGFWSFFFVRFFFVFLFIYKVYHFCLHLKLLLQLFQMQCDLIPDINNTLFIIMQYGLQSHH